MYSQQGNMMKQEVYEIKTQREHVYLRPATYIGSDIAAPTVTWLYDVTTQKMCHTEIMLIAGVERLFLELISNTYDNIIRSLQNNIARGTVEVTIHDQATITVKNYGKPVSVYQEQGCWTPAKIFGNLLSGSNFTDNRNASGANGIGAKATNVFSTLFKVTCADPYNGVLYQQNWYNNMLNCTEPVISAYTGEAYTEITYTLDIARFNKVNPSFQGYDATYIALFQRHVADLSCNAIIPTSINDLKFRFTNPLDYAKLFVDSVHHPIIHYQWYPGLVVDKKKQEENCATWLPDVMLVMLDAPNCGSCHSFVNGMQTPEGGSHVNEAYKAIGAPIIAKCNEEVLKVLDKDKSGKSSFTVDISDVKNNVFIFLSVRLQNPNYVNQTKGKINGPAVHLTIEDSKFNIVKKWRLQDQLFLKLQEKQQNAINRADKKKKGVRATHNKGTDANLSNHKSWKERQKCTLVVVEGDSALCYFLELLKLLGPNARDLYGFLPLKGKSLNVMGCGPLEVEKNTEMSALRTMLGALFGLDMSLAQNREKLRYGSLLILSDADVDGIHIAGLIINFFYCFFPALLNSGFVRYWRTPVIRVKGQVTYHSGQQQIVNRKFYHIPQFEAWQHSVSHISPSAIHYYKGLGSSEKKDIAEDHQDPKLVIYSCDEQTPYSINLAFNKEWANQRKKHIAYFMTNSNPVNINDILPAVSNLPITEFINKEFILFSIENMQRSLPDLLDGCKVSIRKVIYGCLKRFKASNAAVKVATLNAYIMEKTCYHHGDAILPKIIVNLACRYVGSNNINLLLPLGMFGNRYKHKAASPRYIFTALNSIIHTIFHNDDKGILQKYYEEGDEVEPQRYYPIIPWLLVNKCIGIGTGHSTNIPPFNPVDLINWIKAKLTNQNLPLLLPYYRNYRGIIKVIDRAAKIIYYSDYSNATTCHTILSGTLPYVEEEKTSNKLTMVSEGRFVVNNGTIIITELPIDVIPSEYEKKLDEMLKNNIISNYNAKSVDDIVYLEIEGFALQESYQDNLKNLGLTTSMGMSNLTVLDENKRPVTYNSPNELIEAWFNYRYPKYQLRKDHLLAVLVEQITKLTHKYNFVVAVIEKRIDVSCLEDGYIRPTLEQLAIPYYVYEETKIIDCSKEHRQRLQNQIIKLKADYDTLNTRTVSDLWLQDLNALGQYYNIKFLVEEETKDNVGIEYKGAEKNKRKRASRQKKK